MLACAVRSKTKRAARQTVLQLSRDIPTMQLIWTVLAIVGGAAIWFLPQAIRWQAKNIRAARRAQQGFYEQLAIVVGSASTPPRVRNVALNLERSVRSPFLLWGIIGQYFWQQLSNSQQNASAFPDLLKQIERLPPAIYSAFGNMCVCAVVSMMCRSPIAYKLIVSVFRYSARCRQFLDILNDMTRSRQAEA